MKETDVWSKFHSAWPYHSERHEPGGGFDSGMPDVWILDKRGMPGLVELKKPATVELSVPQWAWHERWWHSGGRTLVLTCNMPFSVLVWRLYVPRFEKQKLSMLPARDPILGGMKTDEMLWTVAAQLRLQV